MNTTTIATRSIDELPGPKGVPILGNLPQIDPLQFHLSLEGWAREFGPLCRVRFGRNRTLLVSDPVLIGSLLRDRPDALRRTSRSSQIFGEVLTTGVFSAEGDNWKRQRKLVLAVLDPVLSWLASTWHAANEEGATGTRFCEWQYKQEWISWRMNLLPVPGVSWSEQGRHSLRELEAS